MKTCLLHGVKNTTCEYKARSDASMIHLFCRQTGRLYVVGPVQEYNVDQAHADQEGYDGDGHDDILGEQSLTANEAAKEADDNDDKGTDGTPPRHKEGWVVIQARSTVRRSVGGGEYGVHDSATSRESEQIE